MDPANNLRTRSQPILIPGAAEPKPPPTGRGGWSLPAHAFLEQSYYGGSPDRAAASLPAAGFLRQADGPPRTLEMRTIAVTPKPPATHGSKVAIRQNAEAVDIIVATKPDLPTDAELIALKEGIEAAYKAYTDENTDACFAELVSAAESFQAGIEAVKRYPVHLNLMQGCKLHHAFHLLWARGFNQNNNIYYEFGVRGLLTVYRWLLEHANGKDRWLLIYYFNEDPRLRTRMYIVCAEYLHAECAKKNWRVKQNQVELALHFTKEMEEYWRKQRDQKMEALARDCIERLTPKEPDVVTQLVDEFEATPGEPLPKVRFT